MNAFTDMQELLHDFLNEAGELLEDVDLKLVELESRPGDLELLNAIFRGFHTIKGGAGFLEAAALVTLCHRTETVFDHLRSGKLELSPELLDVILAATGEVRRMFEEMAGFAQPVPAPAQLITQLEEVAAGNLSVLGAAVAVPQAQANAALQAQANAGLQMQVNTAPQAPANMAPRAQTDTAHEAQADTAPQAQTASRAGNDAASQSQTAGASQAQSGGASATASAASDEMHWAALYHAITGKPVIVAPAAAAVVTEQAVAQSATAPKPAAAPRAAPAAAKGATAVQAKENTLRIDTQRFDHILNLSGEIGLTKNRLVCLKNGLARSANGVDVAKGLDQVVNELDMLVSDLQNAVMKARMQPVGRVFQKYVRLSRDLARQLGKDVELVIAGEDTEVDKTILEELNDPLVHLVRNAVDHGVEMPADRVAQGKPPKSVVRLEARQTGDQIVIEIADDGKGMRPEVIRAKAIEKGVIGPEEAAQLDDRQSLHLIFLPGFSTKTEVSDLSGRGVGMDVVKTNIQRLKGRIELTSVPGKGSTFTILLPLTLAILPVLNLRLGTQPFAIPLASVREVIELRDSLIQHVSGKPHVLMRGEVLPVVDLATILGRTRTEPAPLGVVTVQGDRAFILAVDGLMGQDEVMIKPLEGTKPRGVAGATISGEGAVVLVLELQELMGGML